MPLTRKQIVTCISLLYLIAASALGGYATSRSDSLSIPISSTLAGFTTFLPIVSGILLELGYDLTRVQEKRKRRPRGQTPRPPLVIIANTLIFIYSSVVITLLGTHAAPPAGLNCSLEQRWTRLFSNKNVDAIRTIQDAFACCGFRNAHDRAWPFPDKTHGADACQKQLKRTSGCLGPWKAEEQRVAGILMAVVGLVFLWQITIIIIPTNPSSQLHRILPKQISRLIADDEQTTNGQRPRRAIDYIPPADRYRDNPAAEESEDEEEIVGQRAIEGAPQNAKTSSAIDEDVPSQEHIENVWDRN